MISQRKLAANRRNAQRSCGPRTRRGKSHSSQNARRHGLAAIDVRDPELKSVISDDVRTLCGDDRDPRLAEVAATIAECDLILRAVRKEKELAINRVREPTMRARARQDEWRKHAAAWDEEVRLAVLEFEFLTGASIGTDFEAESLREIGRTDMPLSGELAVQKIASSALAPKASWRVVTVDRDEFAAMFEAKPDLMRLERYERRAWSRRRRAIFEFIAIKAQGGAV